MNAWLNSHWMFIAAIGVGFGLRWAALQFLANATGSGGGPGGGGGRGGGPGGGGRGGKWNKGRITKFICLAMMVFAGLILAVGMFPFISWVVGWGGGFAGFVAVIFSVAVLAAGWHALYFLVALVHDMTDGTPDDEAFTAAFWVPTMLPLGWPALVGLFGNPRGFATGLGVLAVSIVTAIYAHKILTRTHAAEGHYRLWMYVSTAICIFVGIVHIAGLAYVNDLAREHLPPWGYGLLVTGVVVFAVICLFIGLGDWIRNWTPEKWSQWAGMYTIPVFTVLSLHVFNLGANAESSVTRIFGVFS